MRKLLLLAGAGMMAALGTQADAQPRGKAKGAAKVHVDARGFVDINRNGVADFRERRIDRNRNRIDDRVEARWRWGNEWCPPGLARKNNGCLPPGHANRLFSLNQRVATGYRFYTPFNTIPLDLRTRYDLDDDFRYIYRDNVIYVVDPQTRLVNRIIDLLL